MEQSHYSQDKKATLQSMLDLVERGIDPPSPLELFIEISNLCNLQCAMCAPFSALNPDRHRALRSEERGLFDLEILRSPEMKKVLSRALIVNLFGYGEPTIHPKFTEILDYIASFEVMINFFTNGMRFPDSLIESVMKARVHRITFSFSGASAEEYENIYLGGKFDTVLERISALRDAKLAHRSIYPTIEVNSIAFEDHAANLPKFVRQMAAAGVNQIQVKPLIPTAHIPALRGHGGDITQYAKQANEAERLASKLGVNLDLSVWRSATIPQEPKNIDLKSFATVKLRYNNARETEKHQIQRLNDVTPQQRAELLEMASFKPGESFACMEPFKTLYLRVNGETKPCCFTAMDKVSFASGFSDAAGAFSGAGAQALRDGFRNHQYSESICGFCLKNRMAPRHHSFDLIYSGYMSWYRQRFGHAFPGNIENALRLLSSNDEVVAGKVIPVDALTRKVGGASKALSDIRRAVSSIRQRVIGKVDMAVVRPGFVQVSGWAYDTWKLGEVDEVRIWIDGMLRGRAILGIARIDVAKAHGEQAVYSGFTIAIPLQGISVSPGARLICELRSGNAVTRFKSRLGGQLLVPAVPPAAERQLEAVG